MKAKREVQTTAKDFAPIKASCTSSEESRGLVSKK